VPLGPLYREDVLFGRAILAFRIATRESLDACVQEQRQLAAAGQPQTLAAIALRRALLTADQYRRLVAEVRTRFAQRNVGKATAAALALPDITTSGRYGKVTPGDPLGAPREIAPTPLFEPDAPAAPPLAPEPEPMSLSGSDFATDPEAIAAAVAHFERHAEDVVDPSVEILLGSSPKDDDPAEKTGAMSQNQWKERLSGTSRPDFAIRQRLRVPDEREYFDFGPYRRLSILGSGAAGIVYRALDAQGQAVAIKVLANLDANERSLRRFLLEARAAQALVHPGIVPVHDVGVVEEIPYFVMDLIEGRELREILRVERPPRDVLLDVVLRICDPVAYAHAHAIVHRDLKPANIMVRAKDGLPLLTDFGLAKDLNSQAKLTQEGTVLGTPLYSAPELHKDASRASPRSDVYSLGVILYEATCGQLPFWAKSAGELFYRVENEEAPPPSQIDPTSPRALDDVVAGALAKNPLNRTPTVAAFREELGAAILGEHKEAGEETLTVLSRIATKLKIA
jgi:tRNA A-37 threonylcarbamoyl transferase component Bud32